LRLDPILLVEDDDDAELTQTAFREAQVQNAVVRVRDGEEALDYLLGRGRHAGRSPEDAPVVVLLDLNLPRLSGIEVLRAIRADPRVRHLPVVILTSSDEESDRLAAYDSAVNSYVRKPVDYERFVAASRQLSQYWTLVNEPPPRPRSGAGQS
jgi:two-component system response regulator